ncbi:MAG: apolipoprotein N-acyltransferase [Kiritimatiellales bacterium]|nr:apolipoprotein N-acyltransferase [Kiritimatiellales bacterium]
MNALFNRPDFDEPITLALVQPNIPQTEKWDAQKDREIRATLRELTDAASRIDGIDLIAWPETAVPDFVRTSRDSYDLIRQLTQAGGTPLLVGTMDVAFLESGRIYYNSSMLFGPDGNEMAKYDKQHLVPFGEYVPFAGLLRKFTPLDIDFSHGDGNTLLSVPGRPPFAVLICFEDTVAPLSVNAVRAGARWLINQTNDAWFDPSAQSEQHLAHAVFRCVENRVPMARCCNTGVTSIIDAFGFIRRNLDVRTKGFTIGELHPRPKNIEATFYTRHGSAFGKVAVIAGATALFVLRSRNRKTKRTGSENG